MSFLAGPISTACRAEYTLPTPLCQLAEQKGRLDSKTESRKKEALHPTGAAAVHALSCSLHSQEITTKPGTWRLRQNCWALKAGVNCIVETNQKMRKMKCLRVGVGGAPRFALTQHYLTSMRTTQQEGKKEAGTQPSHTLPCVSKNIRSSKLPDND